MDRHLARRRSHRSKSGLEVGLGTRIHARLGSVAPRLCTLARFAARSEARRCGRLEFLRKLSPRRRGARGTSTDGSVGPHERRRHGVRASGRPAGSDGVAGGLSGGRKGRARGGRRAPLRARTRKRLSTDYGRGASRPTSRFCADDRLGQSVSALGRRRAAQAHRHAPRRSMGPCRRTELGLDSYFEVRTCRCSC